MNTKKKSELLLGRRLVDLKTGAMKTITAIPGWAVDWNAEHALGGGSGAGLANLVMSSVWASRCVALRANALAAIPWVIQRTVGEDTEEVEEDHPLIAILNEVGPEGNWNDLIRATEADMNIYGSAYWLKAKPQRGGQIPVGLQRLNPLTIEVNKTQEGIASFRQRLERGFQEFPREDILYFRDYHPTDDLGGLSPTEVAKAAIQIEVNADKYLSAFFENYAMPAVMLTTEQEIHDSAWEELRARFRRMFQGVSKQHKMGILDRGLEAKAISFPLEQLALETVRAEARRSICATYGCPPAIVGAWEAANYATAQEQRMSLYQDTVIPRAEYLAGVINADLVEPLDASLSFAWKYDDLDVMQEDMNTKAQRIALLVQAGIMDRDMALEELGYDTTEIEEEEEEVPPEPPQEEQPQEPPEEKATLPDDKEVLEHALKLWRRKALRRAKAGKSANVEFQSSVIPPVLKSAIDEQLGAAQGPAEVIEIFDNAMTWGQYP